MTRNVLEKSLSIAFKLESVNGVNNSLSSIMIPDGVRLESSSSKGRFLVATRDYTPGDVVVSQLPYVAVLFSEHASKFCNYCFERGDKLRRCSRSRFAHYCSKEHQLKDWKEGYKYECEFLQHCAPRVPPESTRLAARVVWKRKR